MARAIDSCEHVVTEFGHVMGSGASKVFANLSPHELHGIEFRRTRRKGVHMNAGMRSQKRLHRLALMNGMLVPDQHNRSPDTTQQVLTEDHDLIAREVLANATGHTA